MVIAKYGLKLALKNINKGSQWKEIFEFRLEYGI